VEAVGYFALSATEANQVQNAIARLRRNPFRDEVRLLQPFKNRFRCRVNNISIVFDLLPTDGILVVLGVSVYKDRAGGITRTVEEKSNADIDSD